MPRHVMKTQLSRYCQDYEDVLAPFHQLVEETLAAIEKEPSHAVITEPLAGLKDVGHRLKALLEKIENQQAYLLIFGPLKSGKSTLMNAISGTYVSEVTSLPAYPCLVHVSHGDQPALSITKYNGKTAKFQDNGELQDMVTRNHAALAEKLRQKEHAGQPFEPSSDFPDAIRRVDIRFPIPNLKGSGTVLVDTPGLYSRMKFGYDLMTREFRDSAACAIFVVKTDNLYLEQVFAEFKDLLSLFSRILLVVNIDTGKRDLRPDGTLAPSLESQDPDKVIEAFETLAMNAQLRDALEEGRLKIYPIDLLGAAAGLLQENPPPPAVDPTGANEVVALETADPAQSRPDTAAFSQFMGDLTEYLNSNDYFVAFVRDSLRQGRHFCEEVIRLGNPSQMTSLQEELRTLDQALAKESEVVQAIQALRREPREGLFDKVFPAIRVKTTELAGKLKGEAREQLLQGVEKWFQTSENLKSLEEKYWNPVLCDFSRKIADFVQAEVSQLSGGDHGGAAFSREAIQALERLQIQVSSWMPEVLKAVPGVAAIPIPVANLRSRDVPVRRSLLDWLLFRSQANVRRRLFGEPDRRDLEVSPDKKRRRLGDPGRQALNRMAEQCLTDKEAQLPAASTDKICGGYGEGFASALYRDLDRILHEGEQRTKELRARQDSAERIHKCLSAMQERMESMMSGVEELNDKYHPGHNA